jgi:hypothetical protein
MRCEVDAIKVLQLKEQKNIFSDKVLKECLIGNKRANFLELKHDFG